MKTEVIYIENLKCHGCANTIKRELSRIKTVQNVEVKHEDSSVTINFEGEKDLREVFLKKLAKLGYPEKGEGSMGATVKSYVSCAIGRINK